MGQARQRWDIEQIEHIGPMGQARRIQQIEENTNTKQLKQWGQASQI